MGTVSLPPRVFVDTSAFVALFRTRDVHYDRARTISEQMLRERTIGIATEIAIAETMTVLSMWEGKEAAVRFWNWLQEEDMDIVSISPEVRDRAFEIFAHHPSKNFPFFDAVSLALMEREGITHAFSFDRHFPRRVP